NSEPFHHLPLLILSSSSSKASPNYITHIIIKQIIIIKNMHTPVTRNIHHIIIMPEKPRRITPCTDRCPLAIEPSLGAECRVFAELFVSVVCGELEYEIVVTEIAAWCVDGFERIASAVS